MDVCSHLVMPVSEDVKSFYDIPVDPQKSACKTTGEFSLNELENGITDLLNIQDGHGVMEPITPSDKNEVKKGDKLDNANLSKMDSPTSGKCLSKCATFPSSGETPSSPASVEGSKMDGEYDEGGNNATDKSSPLGQAKSAFPYPRSMSLPTPLKLVSAMKGSREKQGKPPPPTKPSVTWAPDVYDPPPTSVSHVPTSNKHQRQNSRRNGKNSKYKGGGKYSRGSSSNNNNSKTSRGSKGKDKKQSQKYNNVSSSSSNNNRRFPQQRMMNDEYDVDCNEEHVYVVTPDPFCGSSFLKKSARERHFSVAEAT